MQKHKCSEPRLVFLFFFGGGGGLGFTLWPVEHWFPVYVCVLFAESCLTLCNPIYCSLPGPSVHGILQARILEWVAISFSKRNYRKKESEVTQSCLTL